MKRLLITALLLTSVLLPAHSGFAADGYGPFAEVGEVLILLEENHVSKPTEPQLVQGALKHVEAELTKAKQPAVQVSANDDTTVELINRLDQWEAKYHLDEQKLNRWAIEGMLETLNDPHTMFFTEEELSRFENSVENQYVGFGFRIRFTNNQLIIREVFNNSPAAAAGIQPGDQLLRADATDLVGKTYEEAYQFLQGKEGSESILTIRRTTSKGVEEKQLKVKRAVLSIPEVTSARFTNGIGYVRLDTFGSDAAKEFQQHLNQLTKGTQPIKGLVFDLRDNGGGYLGAAQDIASLFVEDGLLAYMVDRNDVELTRWVHNGQELGIPVKILVNEGTASASELLSGALRDHGVAQLVGTKTYGKGSAQQVVDLLDGDALKITLHEYLTPKRTVVNHVGLTPDVVVADDVAQVVEALRSLGEKSIELREADGDVSVNGVPFTSTAPLFIRTTDGLKIRAAVLASLTKANDIPTEGYVLLSSYVKANSKLHLTEAKDSIMLTLRNS